MLPLESSLKKALLGTDKNILDDAPTLNVEYARPVTASCFPH